MNYNGHNYRKTKKVLYNNILFDSKLEIKCYQQLKTFELAGTIKDVLYHVVHPIIINEINVGRYEADFTYIIVQSCTKVCTEVKPYNTKSKKSYSENGWPFKWRTFKALYKDTYDTFEIWPECTHKIKDK